MALITCPECGKQISALSDFCVNCGYPLAKMKNAQPAETAAQPADPVPVSALDDSNPEKGEMPPSPFPESPQGRHSAWIKPAAICAAVAVVLSVAFVLIFALPKGTPKQSLLKRLTFDHHYLVNYELREQTSYVIDFSESGRAEKLTITKQDGQAEEYSFTYVFDDKGNPTAFSIPGQLFGKAENILIALNNTYLGNKLTRVDITAENTSEFLSDYDWLFVFQSSYSDALLACGEEEIQLQDGRVIREKQSDHYESFETTYTYQGSRIRSVTTQYFDSARTDTKFLDDRGLLKTFTTTSGGLTRTIAYVFNETSDASGRVCLVGQVDREHSFNLPEDYDITDEGNSKVYFYMDSNGKISERVRESSDDLITTKFDSEGRTVSVVWTIIPPEAPETDDPSRGNTYINYSDRYYEYR